jgi:ATP-binding cassette, subfamily B, bacterial
MSRRNTTRAREYGDLALLRRLLGQVKAYWPHIGGILALSLLTTPLALLSPLPLKIAVDSIIGSEPLPGFLKPLTSEAFARSDAAVLAIVVGLLFAVRVLQRLLEFVTTLLRTYTGEKMVLSFRSQLFRHAQRLSLMYHDSKGTTDSAFRIQYSAPAIQWIAIQNLPNLATSVVTLVGILYVTYKIQPQLALIAIAISPFLYLIARFYGRRLRPRWRQVEELSSSALSVVQEGLAGIRVVKAFGQEDREREHFIKRSSESLRARLRVVYFQGGFTILVGLTTAAGTAAVLFFGVRLVQANELTLGDLLLVMSYLTQLYGPLNALSRSPATLQASLASAERAFLLLDETPDVVEREDAQPLPRASGAVAFRDVSFAYREDHPVLHDISFEVDSGTRVGISGQTGAGKSTLMNLLVRFYDPTVGQILLDGVDLRDCKLADLRNQFAIVLQDPLLFSTTIAENIAYARTDASEVEIIEAAKAANAHEFIVGLPNGYDTKVGERGMSLSGGERQRISLARAFLKDAPILILDEPTSSVDTKTEAVIMEAMERLMQGRTTFMIAHRLGTLANCDARLEIEDGRVVSFEHDTPAAGAADESLADRPPAALFELDLNQVSLGRPEKFARLFRDVAGRHWDVDLDFETRCLPLVERLVMDALDENGIREEPRVVDALASGLGCFAGETIRRNAVLRGSWRPAEGWSAGPVIEFDEFVLDPIGKAHAFLHRGSEDSVAFYADYALEQLNRGTGGELTRSVPRLRRIS